MPEGCAAIVPDPDGRLLEIRLAGGRDIDEGLGIDIDQREPAALHLDHDAMPFLKGVRDLVHVEGDLCRLAGHQRFRPFIAVAELTPEDFGPYQALIAGGYGGGDTWFRARQDVDQFDDEVGIGTGRGEEDVGFQPAGDVSESVSGPVS
jgi:hypothetical protein